MKTEKPRIGISIGDLNSVGIEIILKALQNKEILDFFTPIIFASTKLLTYQKNIFKLNMYLQGIFKPEDAIPGKINVVNLWKENVTIKFGTPSKESTEFGKKSLLAATEALQNGSIDILVATPIHNETFFNPEDFNYNNITHFFEQKLNSPSLTILEHEDLRIAINNPNLPFNEVATSLNKESIKKQIKSFNKSLIQDYCIEKPKIAVLSLNPFYESSESMSKEDIDIVRPAIQELFNSGILAFGPYSADQFFLPNIYNAFDGVFSMYYDQGLIPFKTLSEESGNLYLANLPHIITAPCHGPEYPIAGQNIANHASFIQAIFSGIEIYNFRKDYLGLISNTVKKAKIEGVLGDVDEDLLLEEEEIKNA